jgi:hypothetical protein
MKNRILSFLTIIIFIFFLLPTYSIKAEEALYLKVSTLINNPSKYNEKIIRFKGEVIGEPLGRGNNRWINVLDNEGNAIGIWLSKDFIKDINYYGKYNVRGDMVEVTGIYHSICNEHGGDTDIHANKFTILEKGYLTKEPIKTNRIYIVSLE